MLSDLLNTIRKLNSHMESIKALNMSEEERKLVNDALIELKEVLLKTDSTMADFMETTDIFNRRIENIKNLNLSEKDKKNLIVSLEKLIEITDKI